MSHLQEIADVVIRQERHLAELEQVVVKLAASQSVIQTALRALLAIGGGNHEIRSGLECRLLALRNEVASTEDPVYLARFETELRICGLEMHLNLPAP